MKTKNLLFLLPILALLSLSGCNNMPKDALVRDLDIGATPWTPTVKVGVMATGKAAANLSAAERAELFGQGAKK